MSPTYRSHSVHHVPEPHITLSPTYRSHSVPSCTGAVHHAVSQRLTSLGPQPPHRAARGRRFAWSTGFDRIFCNEGLSTYRLVTITGPGGIGKTRLSLRLASKAADVFDGVTYVPLASISHPDLVPPTVSSALGLAATTTDFIDRVVDYLSGKRWLLLLDNFEQLMGAVYIIADLLRRCPKLTVLATSRGPLRISGEWEYHLWRWGRLASCLLGPEVFV